MNPDSLIVKKGVLSTVPASLCRRHKVVPLDRIQNHLLLAMANPGDADAIDDIRFATGLEVEAVPATERSVLEAIESHYGPEAGLTGETSGHPAVPWGIDSETDDLIKGVEPEDIDEPSADVPPPVVQLVQATLSRAIEEGATHIHLEPLTSGLRIRARVDGLLRDVVTAPRQLAAAILSRVKILARLDIAERRLPQDGRVRLQLGTGKSVEALVATLPTGRGERIVIALTDSQVRLTAIEDLGLPLDDLELLKGAACLPSGLVLVAGPPRSGRSTTLYSLLGFLNSGARCILTTEDPIAHHIEGLGQTQVRPEIGYTYAVALKAFMRQDADVVMVQEIHDAETAGAALEAGLDGRLVLSSIEAKDAAGALLELVRLGTPVRLVSAGVRFVLAQRLIRRLCEHCRTEAEPSALHLERLSAAGYAGGRTFWRAAGCAACGHTGYRGRLLLAESLSVTAAVRATVDDTLAGGAKVETDGGGRLFARQALKRAMEGSTSLDECWRVQAEADMA